MFTLILKARHYNLANAMETIIFFFGLTMIFPKIWEEFTIVNKIFQKSNEALGEGYKKNNIWDDLIISASLGPIFFAYSSTYFVILVTILPVSPVLVLIYLMIYVFSLSLALLIVVILGQRIMANAKIIVDHDGWFKKIFDEIFILIALVIVSGYDKKLQINLLDAGFFDVAKIEQKLLDNHDQAET